MASQQEIQLVQKTLSRTRYENERNVQAIISVLAGNITASRIVDVYSQLRDAGQLKANANVAEIRQILNEPQNWRYGNQTVALENDILRRYNESSDTNIRDFLDFAVTHGEIFDKDHPEYSIKLPVNPTWLKEQELKNGIYDALQKSHWDYSVDCEASRIGVAQYCQKQNLPFTLENAEKAFQNLKDKFIKHNQEWRDAQEAERLRASLLAAYKEPFERRLVGGHWIKTDPRLLAHTPALYEKEQARLAGLTLEQLRAEAAAKTEATARAEAESEEKQRLADLPRAELVEIANQGRQVSSQFAPLPPNYSPPGKEVSIPWSVQLLKRLPPSETKRLIRVYGANAINGAIAPKGN